MPFVATDATTTWHVPRLTPAGPRLAAERVARLDWRQLASELDERGNAVIERLLDDADCAELAALYDAPSVHRSRVVMERHGYGQGEYRYFAYPLPALVEALRTAFYRQLAPLANRWAEMAGSATRYPPEHAEYLERCHGAGQRQPTPLLLRYEAGDYNRLHQDLYGEHLFPLQATILLSSPDRDFTGGEFVLTEQRPRMQSRAEVVPLALGDAVVFAVNHRPVRGTRGVYRVRTRHGVSRLRFGERRTLGLIFHDAR
jgi:hypothetical protein